MRTTTARRTAPGDCGCGEPDVATGCCCGVDDLVHVIGRKYAMSVLERIGRSGTSHFNDLQRALGMSSSTLAATLGDLVRVGLVERAVVEDRPPTTEYDLTPAGRALRGRLRPLLERIRSLE